MAKQDIIAEGSKDVNLQIERNIAKGAENVPSQTKRLIHGTVSTLHVQDYAGVVGNAKIVSNFSRHGNDLGAAIHDAFYFFTIIDQEHNRPNRLGFLSNH